MDYLTNQNDLNQAVHLYKIEEFCFCVVRTGFKSRPSAVLKSNLIRSIEFDTAVARRMKQTLLLVSIDKRLELEADKSKQLLTYCNHQLSPQSRIHFRSPLR